MSDKLLLFKVYIKDKYINCDCLDIYSNTILCKYYLNIDKYNDIYDIVIQLQKILTPYNFIKKCICINQQSKKIYGISEINNKIERVMFDIKNFQEIIYNIDILHKYIIKNTTELIEINNDLKCTLILFIEYKNDSNLGLLKIN